MTAHTIYSQYYYRIRDKETGSYYIGSKYGKDSNPETFWVEYFTSSKTIHEIIKESGPDRFEICKVIPMKNALSFETKILQRIDAMHHPLFMNAHNNHFGNINPMHLPKVVEYVSKKCSETKNDSDWIITVGKEAVRKMVENTNWEERNKKHSETLNDSDWKATVGAEKSRKQKETLNDSDWKATVGAEKIKKRMETINDSDWKATVGKEAQRKRMEVLDLDNLSKKVSITINDSDWKATVGAEKSRKQKETRNSKEWKEENFKTCCYCGKTVSPAMFSRWHGNNCKKRFKDLL